MKKVAILGASSKKSRYSYKALEMLKEYKHKVFPVSLKDNEILGVKCFKNLSEINDEIDTLTIYVNPDILAEYKNDIISLNPKRVIFNPGTESEEIAKLLNENSIKTINACTLVLLQTNNF